MRNIKNFDIFPAFLLLLYYGIGPIESRPLMAGNKPTEAIAKSTKVSRNTSTLNIQDFISPKALTTITILVLQIFNIKPLIIGYTG